METQWYYTDQGQRVGPVSPSQLRELAGSGRLQPSDMVWKDGMSNWTAASHVKGLFVAATQDTAPGSPPPIPVIPASPGIKQPASAISSLSANMRECESCREKIHMDAIKCPHCHRWRNDIQHDINMNLRWALSFLVPFAVAAVAIFYACSEELWWDDCTVFRRGDFFRDFSVSRFLSSLSGWIVVLCLVSLIPLGRMNNRYVRSVRRKTGGGVTEL